MGTGIKCNVQKSKVQKACDKSIALDKRDFQKNVFLFSHTFHGEMFLVKKVIIYIHIYPQQYICFHH